MGERPIIMSSPTVRALLKGRKSQHRMLAWKDARRPCRHGDCIEIIGPNQEDDQPRCVDCSEWLQVSSARPTVWQRVGPGDRLWGRETIWWLDQMRTDRYDFGINYVAEEEPRHLDAPHGWRPPKRQLIPSIHMPRWASRLTLTVTEARIERVQNISEEDAIAEGMIAAPHDRRDAFAFSWNDRHGADAWNDNPEVVVLTFEVERRNIDAREE